MIVCIGEHCHLATVLLILKTMCFPIGSVTICEHHRNPSGNHLKDDFSFSKYGIYRYCTSNPDFWILFVQECETKKEKVTGQALIELAKFSTDGEI